MDTNILIALRNVLKSPKEIISDYIGSSNRINSVGDALELYIKDLFCSTIEEKVLQKKNIAYSKYFSYIGNQNNPPDIIIRGGDAIEVKKIENMNSSIALNSSYPKDKIYANNQMITASCRNCEDWVVKDLIYIIGVSKLKKLNALWFVYGNCFAADKNIYEKIRDNISSSINEISYIEFSKTNEIARVNKVDPLGITYLRIRGMWGIKNPFKVFDYIIEQPPKNSFCVNAILTQEKYKLFPDKNKKELEALQSNLLKIKDVKIKSPNNPAILINAKLISFTRLAL